MRHPTVLVRTGRAAWRTRLLPAAVLAAAILCMGCPQGSAGEPAENFLKRLRAAGYYDVALDYLEDLDSYPGVPSELRDAVALERAQIYLEAAGATRLADEREQYFEAGEEALREFIDSKPEHPRVSEARMKLGTRQLIHAMVLMQSGNLDDATRTKAREEYLEAAGTFDTAIESLRSELEAMPTGQIDEEANPGLTERRERYRGEYMQAQLQAGQARRLAAETYENPAQDGKSLLEDALARLTEFSDKYSGFPPGAMAMLYRGQVQQLLGQDKAALDSYQRVQEQVNDDRLRKAKIEAATGTIQLRLAEKPPQPLAAIERGQPWIDDARPNEKRMPEAQALRLALAKAYLEHRKTAETPKEKKDALSSARQLLNDARRVPGPHVEETQTLLASLGIDTGEADPVASAEAPASLDEAITAAKTLIQTSDQLVLTEQILQNKMKEGGDQAALQAELDSLHENLRTQRQTAASVLRQGLALVRPDSDLDQVNVGRNLLSYVLFRLERFREAAAVGEFLATTNPGDPLGLSGGLTALNAMQSLVRSADDEHRDEMLTGLNAIGSLLIQHWPNDPSVASARGALIAVALNQERWDDARKHLDATPDDAPDKAYFLRIMGNLMWNRYLLRLQADSDDTAAADLLPVAENDLQAGLKPLQPADLTQNELDAALVYVKVLLRQNKDQQAVAALEHPAYGPLTHADKGDQDYQFKAYTTALQVIIGQMSSMDADTAALTDKASQIVGKMQQVAAGSDEAKTRMADNFRSLARDIREQLETAPPAKKATLMSAFETLMSGLAAADNQASTLIMVGQSFAQIGESAMENPDRKAEGKAAELLGRASEMLREALAKVEDADTELRVYYQLGRVERLRGEYAAAVKELLEVVKRKPTMLTAQEEAALALEQWGMASEGKRAQKAHGWAMRGVYPDANKKNQIWGWNTIGKRTAGNPKFREAFFNARYHLALNRFLEGRAINDKKIFLSSISMIRDVYTFYPEMGGPQWRAKFDQLLQQAQSAAGQPPEGLEAFESS